MSFIEVMAYLGGFAFMWMFVAIFAYFLDKSLRRFLDIKLFQDDFWTPSNHSGYMTHCVKCNCILIDRDYCRNCGEENI